MTLLLQGALWGFMFLKNTFLLNIPIYLIKFIFTTKHHLEDVYSFLKSKIILSY